MRMSVIAAIVAVGLAAPVNAATLFFDFGDVNLQAPGNYNHVVANNNPAVTQQPILDAIDSTGAFTGVSMTTAGFNHAGPNTNGTTAPTGAAASIFHAEATRDSLFGHSDNFNVGEPKATGTIVLSGLDSSGGTLYDFTFFGSRTGVGDNRETKYSLAGLNNGIGLLDAANNVSNVVTVAGITPTGAGQITLTVTAGDNNTNGSDFYYLGAMRVNSIAIPEPTALGLMSVALLAAVSKRRGR